MCPWDRMEYATRLFSRSEDFSLLDRNGQLRARPDAGYQRTKLSSVSLLRVWCPGISITKGSYGRELSLSCARRMGTKSKVKCPSDHYNDPSFSSPRICNVTWNTKPLAAKSQWGKDLHSFIHSLSLLNGRYGTGTVYLWNLWIWATKAWVFYEILLMSHISIDIYLINLRGSIAYYSECRLRNRSLAPRLH